MDMLFARRPLWKTGTTPLVRLRLAWVLFLPLCQPVSAGNYFQGVAPVTVPWPGGIVPYRFDTNYTVTATESNAIVAGLREWELAANVKFVRFTNQANYVLLQYTNDGSGTGYYLSGTPATMMLRGLARGLMCHEGGHLFGLQHEHQRSDRTNYIIVNLANVLGGTNGEGGFVIDPNSISFGAYDLVSVMHYGPGTFSNGLGDSLDPLPAYEKYRYKLGNLALSSGDRAAVSNLYGAPLTALSSMVTNTADGGFGSLRAAIYFANDHPGTTIHFNIATNDIGYTNGIFTISLLGELPPLVSAGTVIDGTSQAGFLTSPVIVVDGANVPAAAGPVSGLHFYGTNDTVRALAFNNFSYAGVQLFCPDATSNHVENCYLGLRPDGTNAAPNFHAGIYFQHGAHDNFIGGLNATQRNFISGNAFYGIRLNDPNTDRNVILGNYVGLNASGTAAVTNFYSGIGIWDGPHGTIIGGTNDGARNVISGGGEYGIYISDPNVSGTSVQGNFIGTDFSGTNAVGNVSGGIGLLGGTSANTIGGADVGAGNLLSGNPEYGLILVSSSSNVIQGNCIGTDFSGRMALGNNNAYGGIGVWGGSANNLIGGTNAGAGNLISGNSSYGMFVIDPGTTGNLIQGNRIGTDLTGTNALGNAYAGVALWNGATNNSIGGISVGAGNTIAFNGYAGVNIYDSPTTNNSIRGNRIFSNSGLGIDLVAASDVYPFFTPNDIGDADTGPNNLQNFPVLTNAFGAGSSTVIFGKLNSAANRSFFIDVYRNLIPDFTDYGEGEFYVGSVSVTTDGSGNATFALTNASGNYAGQYFSATATAATGDTSEFSADVLATNATVASAQFGSSFAWRTDGFVFNLTVETNFSYRIQAATDLATEPIIWSDLTNFTPASSSLTFTDGTATSYPARFYRVVSP